MVLATVPTQPMAEVNTEVIAEMISAIAIPILSLDFAGEEGLTPWHAAGA